MNNASEYLIPKANLWWANRTDAKSTTEKLEGKTVLEVQQMMTAAELQKSKNE